MGVQHGAAADAPGCRHRAVPDRDVHAIRAAVREGRGRPEGRPRRSRSTRARAPAPGRRHLAGRPGRGGTARGPRCRRRARSGRRTGRSRGSCSCPPPLQPPPAAAAPPAAAPAAEAPPAAAPAAAPSAPAAAPAAPAERVEVTLDQAVFDEKLAELLEKGTDRRVAEGQARRAAMIAARKKAEGG